MMILYKIYIRLKSNQCEKYKKFSETDWKYFLNTKEKEDLHNFIRDDFSVVKTFFGEFMNTTKMFLSKQQAKPDKESDSKFRRKLSDMESICNNQLCSREPFMNLYIEVLKDFFDQLKKQLEKVKNDRDVILFASYALDAMNISDLFQWKTEGRIDYNKYYEDKERMETDQLFEQLKRVLFPGEK